MVRSIVGIFVGAIAWMAGFFACMSVLAVTWADALAHARVYWTEGVFTFTTPMACFMLLFWALADIGAGWVAMKIARRRGAVWVLAGLLEIYVASIHIVLSWPRFPWWYNLGVVTPVIPAILLGAMLAGTFRSATRTAAA